jgi:hypothetical protein
MSLRWSGQRESTRLPVSRTSTWRHWPVGGSVASGASCSPTNPQNVSSLAGAIQPLEYLPGKQKRSPFA